MKSTLLVLLAFVVAIQCATTQIGYARLKGTDVDPTIEGFAYFVTNGPNVTVAIQAGGITKNVSALHGIHVHQFGDISSGTAASAGGHYVGAGSSTTHGCEDTDTRHEGDMGNWPVTSSGNIVLQTKNLNLLALNGSNSIIGKAIVLHENTDDCATVPSSLRRLAYGVIGVANPAYIPQEVITVLFGGVVPTNNAVSGDTTITKAIAVLSATTANAALTVSGTVTFEQDGTGAITVTGRFTGLTSTKGYGLHIHTFADYYTGNVANGTAAGGHFNPTSSSHGIPPNDTRHAGDLGNICSYDSNGVAYYKYTIPAANAIISLNGANNILGRNIIVHDAYDLGGPTFSAFGARVAQGVIGVLNATVDVATERGLAIPGGVTVSDPLCTAFVPVTTATSAAAATTTTAAATTTTASATTAAASTSGASTGTPAGSSTTGGNGQAGTTSSASLVAMSAVFFVVLAALF